MSPQAELNKQLVSRLFAAIESCDFTVFDEIVAKEAGQLAEHWEVADFATIMRQLKG